MRPALGTWLALLALAGCSNKPVVGTVTGRITLDGKTVEDGLIRFIPTDRNSQPNDCKIANGSYTVTMPIGEKRVEIFWLKSSGPPEDTATQGTTKSTQMIPSKFNTASTLKYTIIQGTQSKDFELPSK